MSSTWSWLPGRKRSAGWPKRLRRRKPPGTRKGKKRPKANPLPGKRQPEPKPPKTQRTGPPHPAMQRPTPPLRPDHDHEEKLPCAEPVGAAAFFAVIAVIRPYSTRFNTTSYPAET